MGDIFKVLKEKDCQQRMLYTAKLSFKNEGDMKTFPDEQRLTRLALEEVIKGFLQAEIKGYYTIT